MGSDLQLIKKLIIHQIISKIAIKNKVLMPIHRKIIKSFKKITSIQEKVQISINSTNNKNKINIKTLKILIR